MTWHDGGTFADFLTELYETRYTGQLVLDVFNGVPRSVRPPGPKVTFAPPVSREKVDKRREVVDALTV